MHRLVSFFIVKSQQWISKGREEKLFYRIFSSRLSRPILLCLAASRWRKGDTQNSVVVPTISVLRRWEQHQCTIHSSVPQTWLSKKLMKICGRCFFPKFSFLCFSCCCRAREDPRGKTTRRYLNLAIDFGLNNSSSLTCSGRAIEDNGEWIC